MSTGTIYDFQVKNAVGEMVSLDKYTGLVVLIVNVASYCGLTHSNYKELKSLNDKYYDRGLRIAAFPCNQFGFQEPYCEADVSNFVKENFEFEPDLYGKVLVNGGPLIGEEEPLWEFLKKEQSGTLVDAIKWNFTKFLVNRKGKVVARYAPATNPESFEEKIVELLDEEL
uniref:Glutathione peroxidase n=1 Tax=Caenorhabditis japonica TaxID=281687 RepID=A0A8R1HXR1_CAEJA